MRSVTDWQTAVMCLRIEPINAPIVRLTAHPVDLMMLNGTIYSTLSGYDFSAWEAVSDMSPGSVDLEGILEIAGISRDDLAAGVYDNARCYAFKTSWANPIEDEQPEVCSLLGKVTLVDDRFIAEEMALVDALNQPVGDTYNANCQKTFGGQEFAGCKKDLAPLTVTGTVTSVTSRYVFRDSARAETAGYFKAGTIRWLTGDNVGLKLQEIKDYAADGTITIHEAFHYPVQVGDQYEMVPGCQKRLEDCKFWSNVTNFGGFSFIPTQNQYSKWGDK